MDMQEGENMQEKETIVENKKSKTTKKRKKSKFKAIYLVPVIFILIVAIVGLSVFQSVFQNGPIYGDRCSGVTAIEETDLDQVVSSIKQSDSTIKNLTIEINCKTIAIDITLTEEATKDTITKTCEDILLAIDEQVGLSKSNNDSKYTDLFGTYNGKTQYHVDFTIEGTGDLYPIFASKHPANDKINFTYNTARDPELAQKLTEDTDEE